VVKNSAKCACNTAMLHKNKNFVAFAHELQMELERSFRKVPNRLNIDG